MKNLFKIFVFIWLSSAIHADDVLLDRTNLNNGQQPPIRIAVFYIAPYVMPASGGQYYGFDISMMNYVCKFLQRQCQYIPMNLTDIYPAILNQSVDLAVGAIVMTPELAQTVEFSIPYMLSDAQFIGPTATSNQPFALSVLNNKKIGVLKNSAYSTEIYSLQIQNPKIVVFNSTDNIISAIKSGDIDVGFMDSHTAYYWQSNSGGSLQTLGNNLPIGFGLAVVANQNNESLILGMNVALRSFQESQDFKTNYRLYLENF